MSGTIGGYDFGEIIDNVVKLSPRAGDLLVISGEWPDDETVMRIGREVASGNVGVRVILAAEGDEVYLLHPQPGDFLLVRGDLDEEAFGRFVADVQGSHPDLHVQHIPDGVLLEIADEAMMRTLGWVRATERGPIPEDAREAEMRLLALAATFGIARSHADDSHRHEDYEAEGRARRALLAEAPALVARLTSPSGDNE